MMNQSLHGLFHKLWTKAVGTEDYNKPEWMELEKKIKDLEYQVEYLKDLHVNEKDN